jgi:hypothetical protein
VMSLKRDIPLRDRIGRAARRTADELYGEDYRQGLIRYYLGAPPRG